MLKAPGSKLKGSKKILGEAAAGKDIIPCAVRLVPCAEFNSQ
jgi:hypothetical protein